MGRGASRLQHQPGLLDPVLDGLEKTGGQGAVDNSMVECQAEGDAGLGRHHAIAHPRLFHHAAHAEYGALGEIGDGGEMVDVPGAQVGDGERAVLESVVKQPPVSGLVGQIGQLLGYGRDRFGVGEPDLGNQQTGAEIHGHADVDLLP